MEALRTGCVDRLPLLLGSRDAVSTYDAQLVGAYTVWFAANCLAMRLQIRAVKF